VKVPTSEVEMIANRCATIAFLYVLILELNMTTSECNAQNSKQPLILKASVDSEIVAVGNELKPIVSVKNVSRKPLDLEYLRPLLVVPTIWDAISNESVQNAPTYVYSLIRANEKTTLPPENEFDLFAIPILIKQQSTSPDNIKHLHAFWATLPGTYVLKYTVPLKNLIPDADGELQASTTITVIDPKKELSGTLSFEDGKGYYLSMGTKGGKGSIWLSTKDEDTLKRLKNSTGKELKVQGCLQRMPLKKSKSSVPAGSLYFSEFQIK